MHVRVKKSWHKPPRTFLHTFIGSRAHTYIQDEEHHSRQSLNSFAILVWVNSSSVSSSHDGFWKCTGGGSLVKGMEIPIPVWMVRSEGQLGEGGRDMDIRGLSRGERERGRGTQKSRLTGPEAPNKRALSSELPRCLCRVRSKLGDHGVAETQLGLEGG